ncbi:hypothetical protein YQE_08103, partial [Dendroctonus ponderosae]
MSPNISVAPHQAGLHSDVGRYAEERKPQPIGTERARKGYIHQLDPNWSVMDNQAKWAGNSLEYGMRQPPMYSEEPPMDFVQRPGHMDNFMGPPFFNNRQPPVSNFGEFIPDVNKLDLPWDNTRPMSDVPDKLSWSNQWNK